MLVQVAPRVRLEAEIRGEGPPVVLLPFLGRSIADLTDLTRLVANGECKAVAVNPRGIGHTVSPPGPWTLQDHADDIAGLIDTLGGRAHVVGWTFGAWIGRALLGSHPDKVASLTLIGAGGHARNKANPILFRMRTRFLRNLGRLDPDKTRRAPLLVRLDALGLRRILAQNYFSPETSPQLVAQWFKGWSPEQALAHLQLLETTDLGDWWSRSDTPITIVQGVDDRLAPVESGYALADRIGRNRASVVEITRAGHAIVTERPFDVARAILDLVSRVPMVASTDATAEPDGMAKQSTKAPVSA